MPFILKEYSDLKKEFENTKEIILKRSGFGSIEQIATTRREQIKFLVYVIENLDHQEQAPRRMPARTVGQKAGILYGAMSVISAIITESLSRGQGSLLRDRLNVCMGITVDEKPDAQQSLHFYRDLNQFLKVMYTNLDSRKGIHFNHPLRFVHIDALERFVKRSFELEEASYNALLASFSKDGQNTAKADAYQTMPVPAKLVSQFENWATLQKNLNALINEELGAKNVADVKLLKTKSRATQLGFLQKLAETLADIPSFKMQPADRTAILAGAMYMVREQIGSEYSKTPLSSDDIGGSLIHTGLTKILKAKESAPEDTEALVTAAQRFITFMTTEGRSIRVNHPFSKLAGFDCQSLCTLTQNIIKTCRVKALDNALPDYRAALNAEREAAEAAKKPEESSGYSFTGMLGSLGRQLFFTPGPAVQAAKEEEDEIEEEEQAPPSAKQDLVKAAKQHKAFN